MIGSLYFDNSTRPLADKIRDMVAFYESKYGRKPTLIAAHKDEPETVVDGIEVRPIPNLTRNHYLIRHDTTQEGHNE